MTLCWVARARGLGAAEGPRSGACWREQGQGRASLSPRGEQRAPSCGAASGCAAAGERASGRAPAAPSQHPPVQHLTQTSLPPTPRLPLARSGPLPWRQVCGQERRQPQQQHVPPLQHILLPRLCGATLRRQRQTRAERAHMPGAAVTAAKRVAPVRQQSALSLLDVFHFSRRGGNPLSHPHAALRRTHTKTQTTRAPRHAALRRANDESANARRPPGATTPL